MKALNSLVLAVASFFLFFSTTCDAQVTINIRYNGEDGNARKYVEEMESSGIADRIRAIEGCIRYDYFYRQSDPFRYGTGKLLGSGAETSYRRDGTSPRTSSS